MNIREVRHRLVVVFLAGLGAGFYLGGLLMWLAVKP